MNNKRFLKYSLNEILAAQIGTKKTNLLLRSLSRGFSGTVNRTIVYRQVIQLTGRVLTFLSMCLRVVSATLVLPLHDVHCSMENKLVSRCFSRIGGEIRTKATDHVDRLPSCFY